MKLRAIFLGLVFYQSLALSWAEDKLTNASYRLSKDFFVEYNKVFKNHWFEKTKNPVDIRLVTQSSKKNISAIDNGLKADMIAVTLASDIDKLVKMGFIDKNWRQKFPNNSSPYYTTIAFLVRKGNPKAIKDWSDLIKPKTSYIFPDPYASTVARFVIASALFYAQDTYSSPKEREEYMQKFHYHLATLSGGGDETAERFLKTNAIDALLTFEMEAHKIKEKYPERELEVVVPPISIFAEFPVAMLDKVVAENNTKALTEEYLNYMYSNEVQNLITEKFHYRVGNAKIMQKQIEKFPTSDLKSMDYLGSWNDYVKNYFNKGGKWDQVMNN